jgi:hypothetical protein
MDPLNAPPAVAIAPAEPVAPAAPVEQALQTAPQVGAEVRPTIDVMKALDLDVSPSEEIERMRQQEAGKHSVDKDMMQETTPTPNTPAEVAPPPVPAEEGAPAPTATPPPVPVEEGSPADVQPAVAPAPAPAEHTQTFSHGGKEYTMEEMERKMAAIERAEQVIARQLVEQQQPSVTPTQQQQPAQPVELTQEQITAQRQETFKNDSQWVDEAVPHLDIDKLSSEEFEAILDGGEGAVETFNNVRQRDIARAVLTARKTILNDMAPAMQQMQQSQEPLMQFHEQQERVQAENVFIERHPEMAEHFIAESREVAQGLIDQYPEQVFQMSTEQFLDEVARQTENWKNEQATQMGFNSWREAPAYGGTPAQMQQQPAPVQQQQVQQQMPAQVQPQARPQPPSTPTGMGTPQVSANGMKSVAQSLRP